MIKHKIVTAIAASALTFSSVVPAAFASTDVFVGNNGAFSDNGVSVNQSTHTSLSQTNNSNFQNNVFSNATTGGNNSSFNTGGSSFVSSGPASSNVSIQNRAGSNIATLPFCGCDMGNTSVSVNGNGAFSRTGVNLTQKQDTHVSQTNNTQFTNNVKSNATTGGNTGSFNTGGNNMNIWNNNNSNWLNQNGWNWNGSMWMWNNSSNNFPNWWNNWFMNNGWNWNNNGWNWVGNNGSNNVQSGSATSNVSIDNAAGINVLH